MSSCVRAGCAGTYEADGYCDTCGRPAPDPASAPSRPSTGPTVTTGTGTTSGRVRRPATSGRISTGRVRGGTSLVELAPVPRRDPTSAVLSDPQVPPGRRVCRKCGRPVGQARGDKPGLSHGFCPHDGTPFSFVPGLSPGTLVDGRYEVLGCIAYGGLGWIYLARDVKLGDAVAEVWVVLKGLIDVDDPDAIRSAENERHFLIEMDHPNVVRALNFVQHPDAHTGRPVGYIVMEYLGGRSLYDIYRSHHDDNGQRAPLPLTHVLAYGAEVLQAFHYLHSRGLVYCDLKPDNVIHLGEQVKLIDLGAVLRINDRTGSVYGTPGYQAPEIEQGADPSVASDLYAVGRMLAVLSFDFAGFTKQYRHSLPDPAGIPLLQQEESFYRLLRRATNPDPDRRFSSADEMREQLLKVLAEVLSTADGDPRPTVSARFTPERQAFGTDAGAVSASGEPNGSVDWSAVPKSLPTPLVDPADPAAGFLATLGATEPEELAETLLTAPERSKEVLLRLVDVHIATGDLDSARNDLTEFASAAPLDWRADWYRGLLALAEEQPSEAAEAFGGVYDALPGELAPKLALAVAAEWAGDDNRAEVLYDRVWRTDNGYVSAAFGLARVLRRGGQVTEVVTTLDGVPHTSSQHIFAQVAAIRARLDPEQVAKSDLLDATTRLKRLQMDIERQARLSVEVLTAKLDWTLANGGDADFNEKHLRLELERAYRNLAKVAGNPDARSQLVDRANQVRPKTLL